MTEATFGRRRPGAIVGTSMPAGAAEPAPRATDAPDATAAGSARAQSAGFTGRSTASPRVAAPAHGQTMSDDAKAVLSGKPPQWATVTQGQLSFGVMAVALLLASVLYFYGGGVLRDLLYAGSYKPTHTAIASNGSCTRYQMVLTLCSASLTDRQTGERWTSSFMVVFRGMRGEPMIAVRSTSDPSVVTLGVSAIDYLWNRAISLGLIVLLLGIGLLVGIRKLAAGRYKDGAAFHALVAEVDGIAARHRAQATT